MPETTPVFVGNHSSHQHENIMRRKYHKFRDSHHNTALQTAAPTTLILSSEEAARQLRLSTQMRHLSSTVVLNLPNTEAI